jgi:hypothetical protein
MTTLRLVAGVPFGRAAASRSRGRRGLRLALAPVVAAALASASTAAADVTKAACVTANASAQDLRRDGKLAEAREQLRICNDPKCPAIVRTDCTKRLDEVEAAQPTVVFDAKDGAGADLTAVKVSVDGKVLADRLVGSALQVNPGEHTFTFEVAGQPPVSRHLVLREGEKERHEQVVLGAAATPAPASPPPPPAALPVTPLEMAPAPASTGGLGGQKTLGLVLGGVGVAGLAVGGVFGALTASAISAQKNDCASATNCSNFAQAQSDHSTWSTDGTISTAAFIAGGALVAVGAVLFFTAKRPAEQPAATSLVVTPSVGPQSAGMLLKGAF